LENLLTGDVTRETNLASGVGEDIKSTSRIMTPRGMVQDGVFTPGLSATQSWAVNPGKTGTTSHENFINFVPNINTWEGQEGGIAGLKHGGRTGFFTGAQADTASGKSMSPGTSASGGGRDGPPGQSTVATHQPTTIRTPTTTDDRDGPINPFFDSEEVIEEQKKTDEINRQNALRQMVRDQSEKTETWEKEQTWNKPNKFFSFLGKAALAIIPGLLPAKMATAWNVGKLGWDITKTDRYDRYFELAGINKNEWLSKIGSVDNSKQDLIASLPKGHPERIQLEGLKKETITTERDTGATKDTSIKIENIEEVNDAKTQLLKKYKEMDEASEAALLRQREMEAKRQAYLRNFRRMYMSAQGGRVPAGYNTGGLSNLFRLKNV
jgi:hypothetical protein